MDQENENKNGISVVAVKPEEIEKLTELGFEEDDGCMVLETENGVIGVDKETGVVAVESDGASVEEIAIVSELVASGVAEVTSADETIAEEVENEVENSGGDADNDEE